MSEYYQNVVCTHYILIYSTHNGDDAPQNCLNTKYWFYYRKFLIYFERYLRKGAYYICRLKEN